MINPLEVGGLEKLKQITITAACAGRLAALLKRALRVIHVLARIRQALQAARDAALLLRARTTKPLPLACCFTLNPEQPRGVCSNCIAKPCSVSCYTNYICNCFLPVLSPRINMEH